MNVVSPEEVGFSTDRLGRISDMMQGYADEGKPAGAVTMLAREGEIFHFEPVGLADIDSNRPMEKDSIFRI